MRLPRRIRGILGIALTWAAGWGIMGAVMNGLAAPMWIEIGGGSLIGHVANGALGNAAFGFVTGVVFSLLLLLAERKRTIYQLSLPRVAAWGGLGTLALTTPPILLFGVSPAVSALFALSFSTTGTLSAALTLLAARRGLVAPPGEKRRIGMAAEP
ncbi:MAG TPA: hypothetical protein VF615_11835 [Longimicrobiaceae bacterium]|jgi:hypothetical protein